MISHFSTNPKLTEQGFPTIFRLSGRDDVQGRVAGDLLAERFGDRSIAIIHDGEAYGQGLAEVTKRRLNERGVTEVMFEAIESGQAEYLDIVTKMQAMGVEVLYYGGFRREAGLIVRHAHDRGYDLQLVAGDGIGGEDFALIAGPGADGTLMTNAAIPPASPQAALLAERFAAQGFPGGFGLGSFRTYAVVQVWAQAVEHARTFAPRAVADVLHTLQFDTVLGPLGFDRKGDVTGHNTYVWYVWQGGAFVTLEEAAAKD
jgi:branched-chain amino acid transport system substrate-binding protein